MNAKHLTLGFALVLLIGVGLVPLLTLFAASVTANGKFSFFEYHRLISSSHTWTLIGRSVALSSLTALLSTALGVLLGVLFGRTDLPFRHAFMFLFVIPLLLPPYVIAVAWFDLLGAQGLAVRVLGEYWAESAAGWLFGLPGCVLVLTIVFTPVVMLLVIAYLRTVNPHFEEAARLVAQWPRVLRTISLPMILPGIGSGALLVFLLSLGEFTVPMFFRYDVFPVEILTQFSAFYNVGAATAAASPLALLTLLVLLVERRLQSTNAYELLRGGTQTRTLVVRLGAARSGWTTFMALLCLCLVVLPLSALVLKSSGPAWLDGLSRAWDSLLRSLLYAALGAILLTALGYFLGYLVHSKALRLWWAADFLTLFLLVLPSPVIGISLIESWNRPATAWLYGTPVLLLFGYVAQYTGLTSRVIAAALGQIPASMEQAAALAGAGWFRRQFFIIAPLAKPGLITAWLVGYLFCLRDAGIAMLVYPPGQDTFPVRIFTLMANSPEDRIATLCLMMVAITLLPLAVLAFILRAWKQPR